MYDILNMLNSNSGAITAIATIALVVITAYYARLMHLTLREMEKSRKITFIGKRLEKLYYPIRNTFKRFDIYSIANDIEKINAENIIVHKPEIFQKTIYEKYSSFNKELEKLVPFLYLASKDLKQLLEEFNKNAEEISLSVEIRKSPDTIHQVLGKKVDTIKINNLKRENTHMISLYEKINEEINKEIDSNDSKLNKLL